MSVKNSLQDKEKEEGKRGLDPCWHSLVSGKRSLVNDFDSSWLFCQDCPYRRWWPYMNIHVFNCILIKELFGLIHFVFREIMCQLELRN